MSSIKLTQKQKLQTTLSPQQIQLMKLIQLPATELAMRIKEETQKNVFLENGEGNCDYNYNDGYDHDYDQDTDGEHGQDLDHNDDIDGRDTDIDENVFDYYDYDNDDYRDVNDSSSNSSYRETLITEEKNFRDSLVEQLSFRNLDEKSRKIGEYIIGNIDDSGYLDRGIAEIVGDLRLYYFDVTEKEVEEVLAIVQSLDPAGIAARSLEECMLIQLYRLQEEDDDDYSDAINIVKNYFTYFSNNHINKIVAKSQMSEDDVRVAIAKIKKLNPKPGGDNESSHNVNHVIPDFYITNDGDRLTLTLDGMNTPELTINDEYVKMIDECSNKKGAQYVETTSYLKKNYEAAKDFIELIKNRANTLYETMKAIMYYQYDYFMTGDVSKLKPMILKDIANIVKLDVSTVSRVANSKYVQTPFGTFVLKHFFSEGVINEEGEEVSTISIKNIISECIDNEDKSNPLTDDELTALLKEKGYPLSRRTVSKYRDELGILVSRLRKE